MTNNTPRPNRHGFTLVEILVLIAIIGILAGLLLPAIQAARESARSTQCKNNIKHLSLAIINYESAYGMIPRAAYLPETKALRDDSRTLGYDLWIWGTAVLPYIEQNVLYESLDLRLAPAVPPNRAFLQTELSMFRCPSEIGPRRTKIRDPMEFRELQLSVDNYGYNVQLDGLLSNRLHTKFSDVVDGMSNTLLLGETTYTVAQREDIGFGKLFTSTSALSSVLGFHGWGDVYFASYLVDTREITNPGEGGEQLMASSSYHPGGVHCALFDGSVRSLPSSTQPQILKAIATLQGGEIVSEF